MKRTSAVAVVIPHYREHLTSTQKISLQQWKKHLSSYDTFALSPKGIHSPHPKIKSKYFPSEYFSSIHGYSQLLLSEKFYQAFSKYEYILIYQWDALVFSDQLKKWCGKDMSYIGAPWFSTHIGSLTSPTSDLRGGNGGLSLRNVQESLKVLKTINKSATLHLPHRTQQWAWFSLSILLGRTKKRWLATKANQYPFNEDGFWSFEAPKYSESFKPATQKDSVQFSFETFPEKCFELNNGKLPFGTHAWEKYDRKFWITRIPFLSRKFS